MKIRLDYIAIIALLVGFYIPEYAFIGEWAVDITVALMTVAALVMVMAYHNLLFKVKQPTTPRKPDTIESKLMSFIILVILVGLTAQAGYTTSAFAILLLSALLQTLNLKFRAGFKKGVK